MRPARVMYAEDFLALPDVGGSLSSGQKWLMGGVIFAGVLVTGWLLLGGK